MVFDPKTSLRCSKSLLSPLRPELGLVLSFRAISVLPPRSAILATPSSPRCSMSSRSCLRVTPYLLPAAMVRPRLTSFQHELGWTNLKYQKHQHQLRNIGNMFLPLSVPAHNRPPHPSLLPHLQFTFQFRIQNRKLFSSVIEKSGTAGIFVQVTTIYQIFPFAYQCEDIRAM